MDIRHSPLLNDLTVRQAEDGHPLDPYFAADRCDALKFAELNACRRESDCNFASLGHAKIAFAPEFVLRAEHDGVVLRENSRRRLTAAKDSGGEDQVWSSFTSALTG